MTAEVQIGDRTYLIGKMPAEVQFHVFRRVMPLIKPILDSLLDGMSFSPLLVVAISEDLAKLSDEQLNYVIRECMNVVQVQTEGKPLKLMVNGRPMFGDMDLPTMMQVTWAVLQENFRPFLKGFLVSRSKDEDQTQETS